MELILAITLIVTMIALFDFVAVKWGKDMRRGGNSNGYDPREDWNPHY
jgi:hypothetical protein